jgi:asparagine synthase (glutamine-hydrolysing)
VWLDGEFYNRDQICQSLGSDACSDPQLLVELFRANRKDETFRFLRQINGIYSAVLYDVERRLLYLITDRYGLCHMYWTEQGGRLAWASEYKAFLALPAFQPEIDRRTVTDYFEMGHCLEDRTWFEGVQVLSPGSVLVCDLPQGVQRKVRYWGWDQIQPMSGATDEGEVVEEAGRLFRQAVARACAVGGRVGVHLSGGLDSRALLAAIPERDEPIHTVTFGQRGCDDIRFAQQAAKVRGAIHHVAEMNAANWLDDRFDAVWWLDGQKNLLHMHALHGLRVSRAYYDANLHGYLAAALIMLTCSGGDRPTRSPRAATRPRAGCAGG